MVDTACDSERAPRRCAPNGNMPRRIFLWSIANFAPITLSKCSALNSYLRTSNVKTQETHSVTLFGRAECKDAGGKFSAAGEALTSSGMYNATPL